MKFHINQRVKVIIAGCGREPRKYNGGRSIPAGATGKVISGSVLTNTGEVGYRVRLDDYPGPIRGYKIEAYNLRPLIGPNASVSEEYSNLLDRLGVKNKKPVHDGVTLHEVQT